MKKLFIIFFILTGFAFGTVKQKPYTIVMCNTKNIQNANNFIKRYLKNQKKDIFIIKSKKTYITSYGAFKNYNEAKKYKQSLPKKLKNLKPYILKTKHNLLEKKIKGSLVKIIPLKMIKKRMLKKAPVEEIVLETPSINKQKTFSTNKVKPLAPIKPEKKKEKKKQIIKETIKDIENTSKPKKEKNYIYKAPTYKFGVSFEYSPTTITGDMKFKNGSSVNIKNDLGINSSKSSFTPKLYVKKGNHKVYTSFNNIKFNDKSTLSKNATLGSNLFASTSNIETTIDTKSIKGGYRYSYLSSQIGFDLEGYENKFDIKDSTKQTKVDSTFTIPSLAIDMNHNINNILFNYGGSYGLTSKVKYYDYYLGLGVKNIFINNSSLSIGYKEKLYDIDESAYNLDTKYSGGYINFTKEF